MKHRKESGVNEATDASEKRGWPTRLVAAGLVFWAAGALAGEGLMFVGVGLCLVGVLVRRETRPRLNDAGLIAFFAFVAWSALGSLTALRPLGVGAPWSVLHLALFPVALTGWRRLGTRDRDAVLRTTLVVAGGVVALAWVQHFVVLDYPAWLARIAPVHRVSEPTRVLGGYMAGGLHFHRLKHAHTLVPLLLAMMTYAGRLTGRRLAIIGAILFAGLVMVSVGFTEAKAALGAAGVGLALYVVARWLGASSRRMAAGAMLVAGAVLPWTLLFLGRGPSDRTVAWRTALGFFKSHPLGGVGYGGYPSAALAQDGIHSAFPLIHVDAHALFLQVLAEGGVVGGALVVFMVARYLRLLGEITPARLGVIGCAAVLGVTHNIAFHPVVVGAFALGLAVAETSASEETTAVAGENHSVEPLATT